MTLAGEAGSLLRIEEEIRAAIAEARALAQCQSAPRQFSLFPEPPGPAQRELDLSTTEEQFWADSERRIYAALRDYAEQAEGSDGLRRRLFAEDAARGFAFIDLCRQQYDAIVMNPPFGAGASAAKGYLESRFPRSKQDLLACFVEQGLARQPSGGLLGAITSRTGFFLGSFRRWREEVVLGLAQPIIFADLGYGVMDAAMVEAAAYCLRKR